MGGLFIWFGSHRGCFERRRVDSACHCSDGSTEVPGSFAAYVRHLPMARLLLFLLLHCTCLTMGTCTAQETYRYRAVLSVPSGAANKVLYTRLEKLIGPGKWEFTEATGALELKMRSALTGEELQAQVADIGVVVSAFEPMATSLVAPITPRRRFPAHPDFPVFLDTGDPILDAHRYEQEKSTWIAMHPEAYLEMSAPVPVTHTQQAE